MNKLIATFFLFCALLTCKGFATECEMKENGIYAGAFGGANWLYLPDMHHVKSEFKTGYLTGVSLGYRFVDLVRVEAEVSYRNNSINKIKYHGEDIHFNGCLHTHTWAYMGNVFYDYEINSCLTSYLGAGFGAAERHVHLKAKNSSASESDASSYRARQTRCAWQAIAGLSTPVCILDADMDVGVEYRFFRAINEGGRAQDHAAVLSLKHFF